MSFFDRMLGRNNNESKGSGNTAKDRLKFVLVHDRIEVAPEKLKAMKEEIIAVIAKYVPEVDPQSVDIAFEQSDRFSNKLVAEIPFTKPRARAVQEDIDENDDLSRSLMGDDHLADTVRSSALSDDMMDTIDDASADDAPPTDDTVAEDDDPTHNS